MADATGTYSPEALPAKSMGERLRDVLNYILGRNALIGVASLMLLAISGFATWSGMSDFIIGVSTSPASQGRQIPGGLSVTNEMLVIAIVVALTFLMWLTLRETFGIKRRWRDRLITFPLYIFLALWSVGFGYGFWWSLIAGEEATRTSMANLKEDARDAAGAIAARLDAVRVQLDSVVTWSDGQMAREERSGGSCGIPSGAGKGPLYNARRSVRDSVASLRDSIKTSWLGPVQADIEALKNTTAGAVGATVEERQRTFEAMASQVRGRARSIAQRSNELGKSTASEMRALADSVSVKPGAQGFSCYDPTLAQRLRQAAAQAAEPAVLKLRAASFNEGPAGVANAVKKLWANMGSYMAYPVRFVVSGGKDSSGSALEGISGRDLIALLATLGVDLGLFALTALNPPPPARPDMRFKARIREAIYVAIKRAPGKNLEWVHRHLVHHNGKSYFVIPNLYRTGEMPSESDSEEKMRSEKMSGLAMNQLTGVLYDLQLIAPVTRKELRKLGREEQRDSRSDLEPHRRSEAVQSEDGGATGSDPKAQPLRNHGLLSKTRRALDIANWSEEAQRDPEIFKLLDAGGITPLLTVLNEESERHLSTAETEDAYLARLIKGTDTDAGPQDAIKRLRDSYASVKSQIDRIIQERGDLEAPVKEVRGELWDKIRKVDDELTKEWIGDQSTTYKMSELQTAGIQSGLELFLELKAIASVLAKSSHDQDIGVVIEDFLKSTSTMTADELVGVLQRIQKQ